MHFIPFLCLRCNEETEIIGVDDGEMGEFAYDYVGIDIEVGPRHLYPSDVVAASQAGLSHPPMHQHHEVKTSIASEPLSDYSSQYPLNHFPMKAIRG
jgi:ammonium transporter, Amt family